jgi:hypothetical protein
MYNLLHVFEKAFVEITQISFNSLISEANHYQFVIKIYSIFKVQ